MRLIRIALICLLVSTALVAAGGGRQGRRASAQSYDLCVEDDSNKSNALRFSSTTGEYMFCAGGASFRGTGSVAKSGNALTLQHAAADRRVTARVDTAAGQGSASVQAPPGKTVGSVRDTNTANSTCGCR
jgi:hypothetical protein